MSSVNRRSTRIQKNEEKQKVLREKAEEEEKQKIEEERKRTEDLKMKLAAKKEELALKRKRVEELKKTSKKKRNIPSTSSAPVPYDDSDEDQEDSVAEITLTSMLRSMDWLSGLVQTKLSASSYEEIAASWNELGVRVEQGPPIELADLVKEEVGNDDELDENIEGGEGGKTPDAKTMTSEFTFETCGSEVEIDTAHVDEAEMNTTNGGNFSRNQRTGPTHSGNWSCDIYMITCAIVTKLNEQSAEDVIKNLSILGISAETSAIRTEQNRVGGMCTKTARNRLTFRASIELARRLDSLLDDPTFPQRLHQLNIRAESETGHFLGLARNFTVNDVISCSVIQHVTIGISETGTNAFFSPRKIIVESNELRSLTLSDMFNSSAFSALLKDAFKNLSAAGQKGFRYLAKTNGVDRSVFA